MLTINYLHKLHHLEKNVFSCFLNEPKLSTQRKNKAVKVTQSGQTLHLQFYIRSLWLRADCGWRSWGLSWSMKQLHHVGSWKLKQDLTFKRLGYQKKSSVCSSGESCCRVLNQLNAIKVCCCWCMRVISYSFVIKAASLSSGLLDQPVDLQVPWFCKFAIVP